MRHRLTLEAAARTADGAGGASLAWETVAAMWADVVPVKAEERRIGEALADVVTHRILIRSRNDVAAGDRFTLGSRAFRIRSVADMEEDGRYLTCLCEEERAP
jgi:SPP1 family predicted phage head-tail adaptor